MNKVLKIAWIKRITENVHPAWKIIPEFAAAKYGGLSFLTKCQYDIKHFNFDNLPPFYQTLLKYWQEYCNSLLYGVPKYLLLRLQRVLNCAARIVFKSNKYDHITPLLKELHWLPIEQRIKFKILLITFKALNKQAPNYITDLLIPYKPSRSLRSSTRNFLMKPVFNLKAYGGRCFVLASAVLWNDLPQSIKDSQSVETFKQKLKTHLFLQSYNGQ